MASSPGKKSSRGAVDDTAAVASGRSCTQITRWLRAANGPGRPLSSGAALAPALIKHGKYILAGAGVCWYVDVGAEVRARVVNLLPDAHPSFQPAADLCGHLLHAKRVSRKQKGEAGQGA